MGLRFFVHFFFLTSVLGCSAVLDLDRFEQSPSPDGSDGDASVDAGADAAMDAGQDAETDGADAEADAAEDAETDAAEDAAVEAGIGCDNPRTLCVRLDPFSPHENDLVVVDLVASSGHLRARAILEPLADTGNSADIVMPLAIGANEVPDEGEDHRLHLQIWGDRNDNGEYDPDPDHDWIVELPASGTLVFEHSSAFDPLDEPYSIGGDFRIGFTDMGVHLGHMLEIMVIEDATDRTVGLYRKQSVEDENFEIVIPGIIDVGGVGYRVEIYADRNGNRSYDEPTTDHAWLLLGESDDQEARFVLDHRKMFTPLEYQFDFEE